MKILEIQTSNFTLIKTNRGIDGGIKMSTRKIINLFLLLFVMVACACQAPEPVDDGPDDVVNDPVVDDDDSAVDSDDDDSAVDSDDDDSAVDSEDPSPITWSDCGGMIGDHPCDFTFEDQHGNDWNLYDNYGKVIVLDFSTMWCHWCKVAAGTVQTHMDTYGSHDFVWVTVLVDDVTGGSVEVLEAEAWADTYGITSAPVLAADRSIIDLTAEDGFPVSSWPTMVIVDREMNISQGILGWSEEQMVEWIEDELGL